MSAPRKIFLAWEAGRNLGHAAKIAQIVAALPEQDIIVAARDVASVRRFPLGANVTVLPAPLAPDHPGASGGTSFGDNLRAIGYHSPTVLGPLIDGWWALFRLTAPDIVVCQSAPSALIAARHAKLPVINVGTGFDIPPALTPMPPFYHWEPTPDAAALGEARTLTTINTVLAERGCQPDTSLAQTLRADQNLLTTWPELDHYPARARAKEQVRYVGAVHATSSGTQVDWIGNKPRIFAYLRSTTPQMTTLISALQNFGATCDVVLASPGLNPELGEKLRGHGVRWSDEPVRLREFLQHADLCVSHGSFGVVTAAAAVGVPQIAIPTQREQMMMAHCIGQAGIGVSLVHNAPPQALEKVIRKSLGDAPMRQHARELAARIGAQADPQSGAQAVAETILNWPS